MVLSLVFFLQRELLVIVVTGSIISVIINFGFVEFRLGLGLGGMQ